MESLKLLDCFYQPGTIDSWTFVTDERDNWTGYSTMLATDETGSAFSQWTSGFYEPGELNPHLGYRPRFIGEILVHHLLARMAEG